MISGSGNDVKIVYRARVTPAARPPFAPAPSAPDPLAEAVRLKTTGSSDPAVLSYLTRNDADLPDVIDADVIKDLRRAGAGDSVIAFLTTSAAIGIGETGEGSDVSPDLRRRRPVRGGVSGAISMGYPFYGGYGGGYFPGGLRPSLPPPGLHEAHRVSARGPSGASPCSRGLIRFPPACPAAAGWDTGPAGPNLFRERRTSCRQATEDLSFAKRRDHAAQGLSQDLGGGGRGGRDAGRVFRPDRVRKRR